jgi:MraZ protein
VLLFTGTSDHAIDAKGRLAVPAKYRNLLDPDRDGTHWYCAAWSDGTLRLYTQRRFENLAEQASQTLTPDEAAAEFEAIFFGLTERLEMDDKGRLPLPRTLLELAGLSAGSEVVIVGAKNRLEIHRRDAWLADLKDKHRRLPALLSRIQNGQGRPDGTQGRE